MVVSADCHGVASPFYPELRQLVQRFLNYGAVHCIVALPMLARYSTYNLLTGQENAVPDGGCLGRGMVTTMWLCQARIRRARPIITAESRPLKHRLRSVAGAFLMVDIQG